MRIAPSSQYRHAERNLTSAARRAYIPPVSMASQAELGPAQVPERSARAATAAMEAREVSVVLADARGERVVGMHVRARNQRVVQRASATCIELARVNELAPDRALLALRGDLALQPLAFAHLPRDA